MLKIKTVAAIVFLFVLLASYAYAYTLITNDNDGNFSGKCDNGGYFGGNNKGSDGIFIVKGPSGYFYESSKNVAIRKACGE
ncbi:MAG: hypothetical protein CVU68_00620 [Deltaproteobacteria bacterium HGW-Deltaproteobacteria-3]|nr:MAG: hypothetical protein CVU68_00620 [Deltaproteobacteria bacterium HGW-Deltaproteobacteria-3]